MPIIRPATSEAIAEACRRLRRGELVAFPTETVYGLGGAALDEAAVRRIFDVKGRPTDNPLIVHVGSETEAEALAVEWDSRARALVRRFWPGPLTLVVPAAAAIPTAVTAGRGTVALRQPAQPAALELLRTFGGPIAAPSANRSGHVSPTCAAHVASEFPDHDLLILDAGPSAVGIESTVLALPPSKGRQPMPTDSGAASPRLLRPGFVTREAIEEVIGPIDAIPVHGQVASPGTRLSHYAPRAPARLLDRDALWHELRGPSSAGRQAALVLGDDRPRPSAAPPLVDQGRWPLVISMPRDPVGYAARLYAGLREADAAEPQEILVEAPAEVTGLWAAIHDRLRRACWPERSGDAR